MLVYRGRQTFHYRDVSSQEVSSRDVSLPLGSETSCKNQLMVVKRLVKNNIICIYLLTFSLFFQLIYR